MLTTLEVARVRLVKNRSGIVGSRERASHAIMISSRPSPSARGSSTCTDPHRCVITLTPDERLTAGS
jgi:hypothetical protein